ncbi:MAG TPA: CheR family methyltransferase [Bacteroidales bacterium]|jgi:chemotaxis protein methyltransferase CheR|nr:CheR family methyltransferase [Bacteroidales bacterium]
MMVSDQDYQLFLYALKTSSRYDFSQYSEKSLKRRILKVLTDHSMNITMLVSKIKSDPLFVEEIVKEITVNTTELFRDPQVWQAIRFNILPRFKNNSVINIWHAGCSTGQEVYSMLILLNELEMLDRARVYATDINTDVMDTARLGEYKYRFNLAYLDNFDKVIKENPYNYEEYNDVPYTKYLELDKANDTIRLHGFLREKPVFKKHDLVTENNTLYVKFDLILCRNVIIYFNYNLQCRVFDLFHQSLYDTGCLIMGMHETILGAPAARFQKKGHAYFKN